MTHLAKLIRHNTWANQTWLDALDVVAIDDEYLRRTLSHVLRGEQAWFSRIEGEVVDPDLWTPLSATEFETMQARHTATYARCLEGDLERVVSYRRSDEQYQSSVADILLHLCTHGAHHRGQMASYASGCGISAPRVDFISYCRAKGS